MPGPLKLYNSSTHSFLDNLNDQLPNISVIIPAHNVETSLGICIDSVLNQSTPPKEIIIINDGSTDNTAAIAKRYADRIIYLEQENQGQGAARNAGLAITKGDLVAFLDADDYWMPTFLERCSTFLKDHKEAVAVSTGLIIRLFGNESKVISIQNNQDRDPNTPYMIKNFFEYWAQNDHVRTGSNVIRRKVIDQAGFQRADLRISQDLEYWALIGTYGRWGYIPEPLWVGNSRNAAASNWIKKYSARRKMCPSVDAWQERLLPLINSEDINGFEVVRGRVALNFAHAKIISRKFKEAYEIVKTYSNNMPNNKMAWLLKLGIRMKLPGFCSIAYILIIKEYLKGLGLR